MEKSKQWRASFTALQGSKTARVKEIATTVSGVAVTLNACQLMLLNRQKEMGTTVEHQQVCISRQNAGNYEQADDRRETANPNTGKEFRCYYEGS